MVRTTTLQGTVASGQRVTGDIGDQLRIDSLQDSSRYDSHQQNAGIGQDSGSAASDTRAGISGSAGNSSMRSGDAETGMANPTFTPPVACRPPSRLAGAAVRQAGWLSECVRCSSPPRLAAGGRDSRCARLPQADEYRYRRVPRIKQQPR